MGSVDMFEVAESLGFHVDVWPLPVGEVHEVAYRGNIAVALDLDDAGQRWAAAHGVGHCIMHGENNLLWVRKHSLLHPLFESEAEGFALGLLVDMEEARRERFEYRSEIAEYFGVVLEVIPCEVIW